MAIDKLQRNAYNVILIDLDVGYGLKDKLAKENAGIHLARAIKGNGDFKEFLTTIKPKNRQAKIFVTTGPYGVDNQDTLYADISFIDKGDWSDKRRLKVLLGKSVEK